VAAPARETYQKLVEIRGMDWNGPQRFFAAAASIMRRILMDHARARRRN